MGSVTSESSASAVHLANMAFHSLTVCMFLAVSVSCVYSSRPHYSPTPYPSRPYAPSYSPHHKPAYKPYTPYKPAPSYHHRPAYKPAPYHPAPAHYCLEDYEYPEYDIKAAIAHHKYKFLELYADVADLNTDNSVDRLHELEEETYLCPSETAYIRPLRAINTSDKYRIIVNNVKVDYDHFTQTVRVEDCLTAGDSCPKVPPCYETTCLQKSIVHRFLVYDPYDEYFPFAIETFELHASCACFVGAYTFDH